MTASLSVAVIGAGPSGLVAMKELLEAGHRVRCFERRDDVGGVFYYRPDEAGIYDSCELTVSNYFMAFSSLPPEADDPRRFWSQAEYHAYLKRFVRAFDLAPHLSLSAAVSFVEALDDGDFKVGVDTAEGYVEERFDAVAICTGAHQSPKRPTLEGEERFGGELLHSSAYQDPTPFAGKKVVCVGIGESAADVVHQISGVAERCVLSFRRPPAVVVKHIEGHPSDTLTSRAAYSISCDDLDKKLLRRSERTLARGAEGEARLICSWNIQNGGMARKFLTKNDIFLPDIVAGRVHVNGAGLSHLSPGRVHFKDGEVVEADCVVFNTGYSVGFPFLRGVEVTDVRQLFRHSLLPEAGHRLAFLGFARPAEGGIPACSEMQARLFARLLSGTLELPDPDALRRLVAQESAREELRFSSSASIKTLVPYVQYMDAMAELLGCAPITPDLEGEDPELYEAIWYGSMVSAQFRLRGPGATPARAREVLGRLEVVFDAKRRERYRRIRQRFLERDAREPVLTERIYDNSLFLRPRG